MKRSKKRTKRELIEGVQNTLEKHKKFDRKTISYGDRWIMPDRNFKYCQPVPERIVTGFWRVFLGIFGPPYLKIAFGARVTGKENLKVLNDTGVITVCNHINYVDTLFVRQAIGYFNSLHTMAPWNNKRGIGGHIVRHGGVLPFSTDIEAMRNLNKEMERQLARGKRVNFYPEQVMWWNYQKPRPMKDGAFHYAVKFGVPVVPLFCTFQKSKRGAIKKLRIHILPAVYADDTLPRKERIKQMKTVAEAEWKNCYEQAYGKQLEYM